MVFHRLRSLIPLQLVVSFPGLREWGIESRLAEIDLFKYFDFVAIGKDGYSAGGVVHPRDKAVQDFGKSDGRDYRVYALLGDGEIEEGQVWEAAMAAAKYRLDNLCAVVDVNGLQIDGATADVMPSEPLDQTFEAFNWNVIRVDGHDYAALAEAFAAAAACKGKPTVLLARTVKGKGVSFMENNAGWHGSAPNDEQYAIAMADLEKVGEALCQK